MTIRLPLRDLLLCLLTLGVGAGSTEGCGDDTQASSAGQNDAGAKGSADDEDGGGSLTDGGEPAGTSSTLITTADGNVQGKMEDDVYEFLGIPYAKPPVGDLRWKPPQAVDKWSDTRDATDFGKRCAQVENKTLMTAASEDEDCLYLNVWTKSTAPQKKMAVMVWIHGGGNTGGSTSDPVPFLNSGYFYTGKNLAQNHEVVVVSMNYRLGVFGFFAQSGLSTENGGSSGNQGLWDQRMALQWVKTNIDKFGGDPTNVTLFGESAGSLDTCLHVASPKSRGLFHKAISESGGCTTHQTAKADAETSADAFAKQLGCEGSDALKCLRDKSVSDLLAAGPSNPMSPGSFGPVVDGEFFPDQPRALFDKGDIAKVPYILGSNTDEGTLFTSALGAISSQDDLTAALMSRYGSSASVIAAQYPVDKFADAMPNPYQAVLDRVVGDSIIVCTTYDSAVRAANAGSPGVYMYNFDIPVTGVPIYLGASHGSELAYVFDSSPAFNDDAHAASDRIERYWTNFAKTGDPNGGDDLAWPKFAEDKNVRINLAQMPTIVNDFRATECSFWRAAYSMMFTM